MNRTDLERLEDARSYVGRALTNGAGLSRDDLLRFDQPVEAVLFSLVIPGEALGRVTEAVRSLAPEVPWHPIVGMRNRIVHSYWQIDMEIVWAVLERDLPQLATALERLVPVARSISR